MSPGSHGVTPITQSLHHCQFKRLLKANGEDVKTVQELLRHANSRITLDVYTQAVNSTERAAQSKVVRMMVSNVGTAIANLGTNDLSDKVQIAGLQACCARNCVSLCVPYHSRCLECMAGTTGLEPATSAVTGQRSNQLSYVPRVKRVHPGVCPHGRRLSGRRTTF